MSKLILTLVLVLVLVSVQANAAIIRFIFPHSGLDISVPPVPIAVTSFRIYWDLSSVTTPSQVVDISLPLIAPDTVVTNATTGISTYTVTMSSPLWLRGSTYCFQFIARAQGALETLDSDRNTRTCKTLTNRPSAVTTVTIP